MPDKQEDYWRHLSEAYQKRGVVLVLGAGVSKACKLPAWDELLLRVGEQVWRAGGRKLVQEMIDAKMSLPVVAGILEAAASKNGRFTTLLRTALYQDFPFTNPVRNLRDQQRFVNFVHGTLPDAQENTTMRAVAALCVVKNTSAGRKPDRRIFIPNPLVHAIVTTNVDSVLRTYLRARYQEWLLRTIESASHNPRRGRISTYYLHGFLKFYTEADDAEEETVDCVFTEQEYYDFFSRPYGVFSYTFLYLLREYSCVFVGMSMQDENIRRLLHYSVTDRLAGASSTYKRPRHYALLAPTNSEKIDALTELSLKRLGTRVLWVKFADIPERLGMVYGQRAWRDVY